jgi:hypothetical protein
MGKFSGADPAQLEARIRECLEAVRAGGAGGGGGGAAADAGPVPGQDVVNSLMDMKSVECLNQKEDHPVAHLLADGDSFLESDADEQVCTHTHTHTHTHTTPHTLTHTHTRARARWRSISKRQC